MENVFLLIAPRQNMVRCPFIFNPPCSAHNDVFDRNYLFMPNYYSLFKI
jgi:hypothetical protein